MKNASITIVNNEVAAPGVATIGNTEYPSLAKAVEKAATGAIIKLVDNVTLESPVNIDKAVTLDLAGMTITNAEGYDDDYLVGVKRGSDLTVISSVKGGAITTDSVMCGIKVTLYGEAAEGTEDVGTLAKLTLGGSGEAFTVQGKNYGVSGNGNRHGTSVTVGSYATVTASDNDGTGIYNPQDGTLTVKGGTITGHNSGIELRAGTLKVTGGIIKATAAEYTSNPNGNGTTATGAAIAIAQHTTKKDIDVTISGGTMTGAAAMSIANPQNNDTPIPTISVSGGTFNGLVKNDDTRITGKFITGGLFSDEDAKQFMVTEGYEWAISQTDSSTGEAKQWKVITTGSATAEYNNQHYTSLLYAFYAAKADGNGAEVKLLKDCDGSISAYSGYDVAFDLNGHTLSQPSINAGSPMVTANSGSKLTIKNTGSTGGINYNRGTGATSVAIKVNGGELVLDESVTVTSVKGGAWLDGTGGKLTVNGTINADKYVAIVTNGSTTKSGTINIGEKAVITSNTVAMYLPGKTDLTVADGAKITGTAGIEAKAGTLTIGNAEITATGTVSHSANGNGTSTAGYAVALVNNKGYMDPRSATISGGTYTGPVGIIDDDNDTTKSHFVLEISGGTFSNDPSLYLTSGMAAGKTTDGKWVVGVAQKEETPISTTTTTANTKVKVYKTTVTVGEDENAVTGSGYSVTVPASGTSTSDETTIALTETEEAPIAGIKEAELAKVVSALIAEESVTVSENTTFAFELEKTDVKNEAASAPTVVNDAEVAFKVSPKLVAYENGTKTGSVKVDNDKLANTFTFTLELGSTYANKTLNLKHYDDNGNFIETLGNYTADEKGNVEVTLGSFSIVLGSEKKAATEFEANGYSSATNSLIYSPVMNLGSNLSYRATFNFSTQVLGKLQDEDPDTYVSISYNGTKKNLKLADLTANTKDGEATGWYEYYQEVVARLMDAPITITLIVDGQPDANLLLTDSAVKKLYTTDGGSYSISVSEVLEGVKTSGTASENERALAETIINYGTAAKNYFANPNG